jgi:hypothetical protein
MAEARVVFTKSKMNKDLDERILTPGEYRDGFNISVSKSEGPDEGVVENVLGNSQLSNFVWNSTKNVDIIGVYEDTNSDRIFVFATNFTDSSSDQLSEFAYGTVTEQGGSKAIPTSNCFIAYIDLVTGAQDILVSGNFLNFSKTHPIYAVDLVEDLLFWTDNRNQPRKINVETAIANPETYYTDEDHISVSKYMPYKPLALLLPGNSTGTFSATSSMVNETEQYLAPQALWPIFSASTNNNVLTFNRKNVDVTAPSSQQMYFKNLNFPELGIFKVDSKPSDTTITYDWPTPDYPYNSGPDIRTAVEAAADKFGDTRGAFEGNDILAFFIENPDYNVEYDGDEDYLKDKFIRFSYRFKYDDGEYSLMAPFTQAAFTPKQYGYFIDSSWESHGASMNWNTSTNAPISNQQPVGGSARLDERDTASTGIVKFMENQVSTINFTLSLPEDVLGNTATQANFADKFKVETIEIIAKESDGLAIKVVEEIDIATAFSGNSTFYTYQYLSNKPFKTLPEAVSTRVHDKVPIRALAQATTGNRVMYGNFIEKHGSPEFLNYFLGYREKPVISSSSQLQRLQRIAYPNHTLKQNRSYKVGVVLVDRYGRNSNVILRDQSQPLGVSQTDSTIYAPYDGGGNSPLNWPGNNVAVNFLDPIPSTKQDGYPGLFSLENPLGYYSYKIVVQQQQQEYYNVYLAGATSGVITFTGELATSNAAASATPDYLQTTQFSNIALFGDNINKVPKELADVGPTEEIYGSETLLFPRVVTTYIVASSNISPSTSIQGYIDQLAVSKNSQIEGKFTSTVNSIISFNDLGKWTSQKNDPGKSYPSKPAGGGATETIDPLYLGASANPFVAQISTDFIIGLSAVDQKGTLTVDPEFSRALNVFETDPVESKLEIYYESSSSDRISVLNNRIENDIGFEDVAGLEFGDSAWQLEEDQSNVILTEIFTVDGNGDAAGFGLIEIVSITANDTAQTDYTNDFELVARGSGLFDFKYIGPGIPVFKLPSGNAPNSGLRLTYTFKAIGVREYTSSVTKSIINKPPVDVTGRTIFSAGSSDTNRTQIFALNNLGDRAVYIINNYSDDTTTYPGDPLSTNGRGANPDGPWNNGSSITNGNQFTSIGILTGTSATNPPIAPATEDDVIRYTNAFVSGGPAVTFIAEGATLGGQPVSPPSIDMFYGDPSGSLSPGNSQNPKWDPNKTLQLYNSDPNGPATGTELNCRIVVQDRSGAGGGVVGNDTTIYYLKLIF